ncbi:S8 family serine peptidase [Streptomyces sp. ISL-11]|uniref:S8 family serine peptidase n=1 Tax=Streptomyces sp. ISL-11 TaxID=2819174 RepID=UPI0020353386|nr:S8 family serine peptidase [Streptomyces sp. ISL-11]
MIGSLLTIGGTIAPAALADTMRERQWYLETMEAERIWKVSTGQGITVAVLDTGVQSSQPELGGKVLAGKNFVGRDDADSQVDRDGHGTAMATLIAGNAASEQHVVGLSPGVNILPVKVLGTTADEARNSVKALVQGIHYAADSKAQVINISMGFEEFTLRGDDQKQIQQAVDYAIQRGKLLLAATGNNGDRGNDVAYPAASAGVAGVGAVDKALNVVKYSTYGSQVALAAAGEEIPIPCNGKSGYCRSGGTSQATAIASASAALIWSKHPDWTGNQVLRVMIQTAGTPTEGEVPSRYVGYGGVRPRIPLLEGKGDPGPPDVNPLVAAKAGASPSPSMKSAPPGQPTRSTPAGSPAKETAGEGSNVFSWVIGGAAAAAAVGAGVFLLLRRQSRSQAATSPDGHPYADLPHGSPPPPMTPPDRHLGG